MPKLLLRMCTVAAAGLAVAVMPDVVGAAGGPTVAFNSQVNYATAVSSNSRAVFVWTDTRNEAPCAAVDAFRAGNGVTPNPDLQCPADAAGRLFGNSDVFAGAIDF